MAPLLRKMTPKTYFGQSWAFAHTVRKLGNLRWLCNLRCALRLIFSGLCNLRCAFTMQFAVLQFAL